jgi:phage baseplate assembly protein W
MSVTKVSRAFKDISLSFIPHPITGDLPILTNENAIRRSVRNLIETIPNEVFFNSLIGSEVRSSLFEFIDAGTASIIKDEIQTTLYNFEPRISNIKVQVEPNNDNNSFNVTIFFDIVGQEFSSQQFSFILEATR